MSGWLLLVIHWLWRRQLPSGNLPDCFMQLGLVPVPVNRQLRDFPTGTSARPAYEARSFLWPLRLLTSVSAPPMRAVTARKAQLDSHTLVTRDSEFGCNRSTT